MSIGMALLLLGAVMLFISAFGGGFEFKGFTIRRINRTSRILGFLVGGIFMSIGIISSDNLNGKILGPGIPGIDAEHASTNGNEDNPGANGSTGNGSDTASSNSDLVNKFEEYDAAWAENIIDNALLLKKYTELTKQPGFDSLTITQIDQVNSRIEDLKVSIKKWDELQAQVVGNKTVAEQLTAWRSYQDIPHLEKDHEEMAQETIAKLENSLNKFASIKTQNNFRTCEKVVNRRCRSEKNRFNLGANNSAAVWVWAKINAPGKENIKLKINKSGSPSMVSDISLSVKRSAGYRTYKLNNISEAGTYEAKLYNSNQQLIGYRTFEVK